MNANQETFLREYLRTGDKRQAYSAAYPKAKESSLKNSANRLLQNNPEIIAAVAAKTAEWEQEAEDEAKVRVKFKYLSKLRAKQLLTLTAEGLLETDKVWRTREGFATHPVTPSHAQILSAIHKYATMEGWYVGKSGGAKGESERMKKEKEEVKKGGPVRFKISIGGLPIEEYEAIHHNTLEAYYDPDGPTWRSEPGNNHTAHHFLPLQKKREQRRDEERAARMTPQLKLEEEQALREFQSRPVDETGYRDHEKVIDELFTNYCKDQKPAKLEALSAVQKMCGLRFLHHRHRYEAEREAGWQFHPFNHALIRPVNSTCHPERSEESARPMQPVQSMKSENQPNQFNQSNLRFRQENRPQTTTNQGRHSERREESPEPMQPAQPETHKELPDNETLRKQGYTHLNELLQDEFDYYIKNQGSTTYKQLNDLKKFAANRNAPPETKTQIEQETGWLYHPEAPNYAKRHPDQPLVRTRFKGLL